MPSHGHAWLRPEKAFDLSVEDFCREIRLVTDSFDTKLVSLHGSDIDFGVWPSVLDKYGVAWIPGADHRDVNALRRMVRLLSQIEVVFTNALGSHVIYALWLGCEVRWLGSRPKEDLQRLASEDPFFKKHPEGANARVLRSVAAMSADAQRDWIHRLSGKYAAEVHDARECISQNLGLESRVAAEEMKELLGWTGFPTRARGFSRAIIDLVGRHKAGLRLWSQGRS